MDISDDQLKKALSSARANADPVGIAIKNEGLTEDHPIAQAFRKGIIQQESGGKANVGASNRNAKGISQILPGTFRSVADKGWDINNPVHNAQSGLRYYKQMHEAADGNPVVAAAGYYGGARALMKAKQGIPLKDPVNPNNPNTLQYGQQVADRAGQVGVSNTDLKNRLTQARNATKPVKDVVKKLVDTTLNLNLDAFKDTAHSGMEHAVSSVPDALLSTEMQARRASPEALARFNKYKDQSTPANVLTGAGLEGLKFIAGVKDLGTKLAKGAVATVINANPSLLNSPTAANIYHGLEKNISDRVLSEAEQDKQYKEFKQLHPYANAIGGTIPYLISGSELGPAFAKAGEAISSVPAKALSSAANEGKGLFTRAVESGLQSTCPSIRNSAEILQRKYTIPMAEKALGKSRQVNLSSPIFNTGKILGSAGLGATEGTLHYDNTAGGGALSSAIGTIAGNKIAPYLTKEINYRKDIPHEMELLKWGKLQGIKPTPGLKYGNQETQHMEAGMANSGMFSNPLKTRLQENEIANNRIAYEAVGVPRNKIDSLTPDDINNHMQDLKKQYDKYEQGTTGQFTSADSAALQAHVQPYQAKATSALATDDEKKVAKVVNDFHNKMVPLMAQQRNALGQVRPTLVNGKDFKDLRSQLQEHISSAYNATDNKVLALQKAAALKPMRDILDSAIERGVRNQHGDVGVAEWKDLNTKYALSNMILESGTNQLSKFDPAKWGNFRLSTDAKRYLTGHNDNGTPIHYGFSQLDKAAKLEFMRTHQAGTELGGLNLHPSELSKKETINEKLLQPVKTRGISTINQAKLKAYLSEYPAHTGYLNMSGKNYGDPVAYIRALQSNLQTYPNTIKSAAGAYDETHKKARALGDKYIAPWLEPTYSGIYDAVKGK